MASCFSPINGTVPCQATPTSCMVRRMCRPLLLLKVHSDGSAIRWKWIARHWHSCLPEKHRQQKDSTSWAASLTASEAGLPAGTSVEDYDPPDDGPDNGLDKQESGELEGPLDNPPSSPHRSILKQIFIACAHMPLAKHLQLWLLIGHQETDHKSVYPLSLESWGIVVVGSISAPLTVV